MSEKIIAALAGQPNTGKSTVFNMLTGARQYVANYPGVTIEKKTGAFSHDGVRVELVDLPGTYSLTSYSLEERVTRNFLLEDRPALVINIVDASNLKRNLYLTFQLLEMEIPVIVALNMMDVAQRRGLDIDHEELSTRLGVEVTPTVGTRGRGKVELREAIRVENTGTRTFEPLRIDYGTMEPLLGELQDKLAQEGSLFADYPGRWLAIKLMEGDSEVEGLVRENLPGAAGFLAYVGEKRQEFESRHDEAPEQHIAFQRHLAADRITKSAVTTKKEASATLSDRVDKVVCNRYLGPVVLIGVLYLLYELSIVQGYNLTNYFWPLLAKIRGLVASVMPDPGFIFDPVIRSFCLWFVDSINALLNYIPIFFILFSLVAILEDIGYMPRMAFLLDRLFRRFGLHGQSTLPLVLGGVFVGGCAIPGVMATKAVPDEKARLATILIVPMMNCLAKTPLYVLLIGVFFPGNKGLAMFFIATVTLLMALPTAKLLTMTVLRKKESAPFIMEMPPYHLPTIQGVLRRAFERLWLFLKKIVTVVAAVAVILFALLQYPGLTGERAAYYDNRAKSLVSTFHKKIKGNRYAERVQGEKLLSLVTYWDEYKTAKLGVKSKKKAAAVNKAFQERNPVFYTIVKPKGDKEAKKVNRAFKKFISGRKKIRREIKEEKIINSYLGRVGKSLEPLTQWAGFNWRINVALLSSFAAKESSVATLGAIYQPSEQGRGETLEQRMKETEKGFTPLHALAIMLFMALYPPCIPAAIAVKLQSGKYRWMLFSIFCPTLMGLIAAGLVFSGGKLLGLSGLQAMFAFYGLALAATIGTGLIEDKPEIQ